MKNAILFEGGGILGSIHPVMLQEIFRIESFSLEDFSIFSGTSIGAINACFLICGYSVKELENLWKNAKEDEVIPKKWLSFVRGRRNNIDNFLLENNKLLKKYPKINFKELYEETGKYLYTISTSLQHNRGLIFGKEYINIPVVQACKYSASHPLQFDPAIFINPKTKLTYYLTDGGIVENCPISPIFIHNDIENVISLATNCNAVKENIKYNKINALKQIVKGIVPRNEFISYYNGFQKFQDKFYLYEALFPFDVDIFDFNLINRLMIEVKYNMYKRKRCDWKTPFLIKTSRR